MAGQYPDVPAPRIAYDIDGTLCIHYDVGAYLPTIMTLSQKTNLNDENDNTPGFFGDDIGGGKGFAFVFPTLTTINGYISAAGTERALNQQMMYSADTTNGIDGTWTLISGGHVALPTNSPFYRTSITTLATPVVAKAIRFHYFSTYSFDRYNVAGIHLYGTPTVNNDLEFWHPTLDQALAGAYFDFGDVAQGTSTIKEFRLKNFSVFNAGNVKVSTNILSETTPTIASQHQFSLNGTNWFSYIDLPETSNIAIKSVNDSPDNISPIIYFRRNNLSNATLGLYTGRIVANVGEWT